jgi:hypothetical protein
MAGRIPAWVIAGIVAAIVSSIPGMAWVVATGEPWWRPIQAIASLVGMHRLGSFDVGALLLGGVLHVLLSLAYALLFRIVTRDWMTVSLLVGGGVYGVAIWVVNFLVADELGFFATLRGATDVRLELVAHVVFGLTLAVVLACIPRTRGTLSR